MDESLHSQQKQDRELTVAHYEHLIAKFRLILNKVGKTTRPPVCCLWGNVCLGLQPIFLIGLFVFLILSCMSCLCVLEINPLSVTSFAIIFSHSEGCLSILFIVSFAVQKP